MFQVSILSLFIWIINLLYTSPIVGIDLNLGTLNKPDEFVSLQKLPKKIIDPISAISRPPILYLDSNDQWQCVLCEKIPTFDNGLIKNTKGKFELILELNDQFIWNDGAPISAMDVKFTMEYYNNLSLELGVPYKFPYSKIKISKSNPKKITILFSNFRRDYLAILTFSLLPFHKINNLQNNNRIYLSSKGFTYGKFSEIEVLKNSIKILPNPNLKLQKKTNFESINIYWTKNLSDSITNLESKKIDILLDFYPDSNQLNTIQSLPKNLKSKMRSGFKQAILLLNLRNPIFTNNEDRLTLYKSIDKGTLNRNIFRGTALESESFRYPRGTLNDYYLDIGLHSYNQNQFHFPNKERTLHIATSNSPNKIKIASEIKNQLVKLGYKIRIDTYSARFFQNNILRKANFKHLALTIFEDLPTNVPLTSFHSTQTPSYPNYEGSNFARWHNKKVDNLLEKYIKLKDEDKLIKLERKIFDQFIVDIPFFPLVYLPKVLLHNEKLKIGDLSKNFFPTVISYEKWSKIEEKDRISTKKK